MSPPGPAPDRLRITTWNLNSLRPRLPAVGRVLERVRRDVLCLQETRTGGLTDAAKATFDDQGYDIAHAASGSWNGVAIAARHPISDVTTMGGFADEHLDKEPRLITALVDLPGTGPARVASVYVPPRTHGRPLALHVQARVPRCARDARVSMARSA